MLEQIRAHIESTTGRRCYLSGEVDGDSTAPYVLLYSLAPQPIRSHARSESARRWRFGTTCVDLGSAHIEGDADRLEQALEGSRILHPLARIELVSRGPLARDPDVTIRGAEYHTLPLHWTATIPKESP